MSWWEVILILLAGWILVFLEVFFIPGITIFAAIGAMSMVTGVVLAYGTFGIVSGTITLISTALFTVLSIMFGFKSGLFNVITLKTIQHGKMNLIDTEKIKVGDIGIALSKIGTIGKALFNDTTYEVESMGEYIDEKTPIEVIKISMNKIFIKMKL
ncbi:MAG: hypothetical protein H0W62_07300 [Chitinophagales bacterium]|nr:hypothetical protein [Chitinophagales bacterium]